MWSKVPSIKDVDVTIIRGKGQKLKKTHFHLPPPPPCLFFDPFCNIVITSKKREMNKSGGGRGLDIGEIF